MQNKERGKVVPVTGRKTTIPLPGQRGRLRRPVGRETVQGVVAVEISDVNCNTMKYEEQTKTGNSQVEWQTILR